MADNADAFNALQEQIDRVRSLPDELGKSAAPLIAKEAKKIVEQDIAASRAPDGTPWPKTEDGHEPLKNAANAVKVSAVDSTIVFEVSGVEAKHHRGRVKGGKRRALIPARSIPQTLTLAIKRALSKTFQNVMGGT